MADMIEKIIKRFTLESKRYVVVRIGSEEVLRKVMKTCPQCGKEFHASGRKKFCRSRCADERKRDRWLDHPRRIFSCRFYTWVCRMKKAGHPPTQAEKDEYWSRFTGKEVRRPYSPKTPQDRPAEKTTQPGSQQVPKLVGELELTVRTWNGLDAHGIETIDQLISKTENDLLQFRNFGKKSLDSLKTEMAKYGLSLASAPPLTAAKNVVR